MTSRTWPRCSASRRAQDSQSSPGASGQRVLEVAAHCAALARDCVHELRHRLDRVEH
jgi:hypothetical protein